MKFILNILTIVFYFSVFAQIHEGKILFERKTNLFKKYTEKSTQNYIKDDNKYRTERFVLYFNDSMSVFVPEENFERDRLSWTTNNNTVIQNFSKDETKTIYSFSGASLLVQDSLIKRTWKFTDKWRTICNQECMQAVYTVNDSIRIYAWFSSAITPNIGPESYCNLPGAILGLANEDGSITYFAKSIEETTFDIEEIMPKFNSKKALTRKELIEKTKKDFKFEKEIDKYILELFLW
ncbi:MAG: GLPGLI family protein [Crocinitomicaceae bacterium]|nr:GLPGLI family protein [Crocinitomicaceae bacterium]